MDAFRRLGTAVIVAAAPITTMFAVAWRAAEEGRGLDLADLRSVLLVGLVVGVVATWTSTRGPAD